MKIFGTGRSDVGVVREHNEDSFNADSDIGLFIVCDGMGGHAAGDVASRMAVENIVRVVADHADQLRRTRDELAGRRGSGTIGMFSPEDPVVRTLKNAVLAANEAIIAKGAENPRYYNMGTTSTVLFFPQPAEAYFAHVGDSRLYHWHAGRTVQRSTDHSLVNDRLRAGIITQEEADASTYKNIITRSVGFNRDLEVDTGSFAFESGDRCLLCSDGFSNYLRPGELDSLIGSGSIDQVLDRCIGLARDRGGDDNITVVIAVAE